ncbi:MAG: ATP-dependent DNA helicase [Gammaproteobacteria bacterium]|nr:ATP-dependent DNA helicase [Gammaproteobacteria bacterium]
MSAPRAAPGADDVTALLGSAGPIADALPGFAVRAEQQAMAGAVATAMAAREVLVCEAGTGTGKTLAYLVPAFASGLRTVISTATRTLQDQLFHRDLPLVQAALGGRRKVALLKGRQNYLCRHRLARAIEDPATDYRRLPLLNHLERWARTSDSGDLEEVSELGDDSGLRAQVTSTTENCLGQECPAWDACYVVRARRAAADADIVVVNHHLLFADLVLREGGFAELLPHADAIVLDEAHKVPDIASNFFGRSLSGQQIGAFCHEAIALAARDASDTPALGRALARFDAAQLRLREVLQPLGRRPEWQSVCARDDVAVRLEDASNALEDVLDALEGVAARSPDLDQMHDRAVDLAERWSLFEAAGDHATVRWLDTSARNFTVYETPISIANEFSVRVAASEAAWIMTSATLAVDGRFDHFTRALGLEGVRTALWQSPFDYVRQSLLYVPPLATEPGRPDFERGIVDAALPVLAASRGRAFFLFTSYRALDAVAATLAAETDYALLIQGSAPRSALIERFLATPRAVLLGTASFWEGVDVRGDRLSCVIIDKLPFGVPDDPVTRARAAALREAGEDPFNALQLPEAVTALKQGAGRLIRDVTDRGVLMICDTRIVNRGYGRAFLRSLPPMPLTRAVSDVADFFAHAAA